MNQSATLAALVSQAIIIDELHNHGAIDKYALSERLRRHAASAIGGLSDMPDDGGTEIACYLDRLAQMLETT